MPRAQAGAFLPDLLERQLPSLFAESDSLDELDNTTVEGRDAITKRYAETDEKILALNVILVYKKVVQGLIYSPPDCDKYLGLDAEPLGPTSSPLVSAPTQAAPQQLAQRLREPVCKERGGHVRSCAVLCLLDVETISLVKHRPTRRTSSAC